jgi:hypothetical protein
MDVLSRKMTTESLDNDVVRLAPVILISGGARNFPLINSIRRKATEPEGIPKPKGTLPEFVSEIAEQTELLDWLELGELVTDDLAELAIDDAIELELRELESGELDEVTETELGALLIAVLDWV